MPLQAWYLLVLLTACDGLILRLAACHLLLIPSIEEGKWSGCSEAASHVTRADANVEAGSRGDTSRARRRRGIREPSIMAEETSLEVPRSRVSTRRGSTRSEVWGTSTNFYALDQLSTFKYTYTVCTCKVYYLLEIILNENVHFFADSVLAL